MTVRSIKGGKERVEWMVLCNQREKKGESGVSRYLLRMCPSLRYLLFHFYHFFLRSLRSICCAYFYFPQFYFFAWCVPYFSFFPFAKLVRHARRRRKIESGKINAKSDRWVFFYADRPSGDIFSFSGGKNPRRLKNSACGGKEKQCLLSSLSLPPLIPFFKSP